MIDERALEAAFRVFTTRNEARDRLQSAKWPINVRDGLSAAIEAYEAARWRPIEEAPKDTLLLVHYPGATWLMVWTGNRWFNMDTLRWTMKQLTDVGAMFRTIEPPKQDAVSSALGGSSAAEDTSSARVTSSDRASSPDGA